MNRMTIGITFASLASLITPVAFASRDLQQKAANAIAVAECNLQRTDEGATVGGAVDELIAQLGRAGIRGSKKLENAITGGKYLEVTPSFLELTYLYMKKECPDLLKFHTKQKAMNELSSTLVSSSMILNWSIAGFKYDFRQAPKSPNKEEVDKHQIHQTCKDARDYEGCVKVKSGGSPPITKNDRFGKPAMGAGFVKFSGADRDYYIHKTSAKSLKVRGDYGRYVSINIVVKGIGNTGYEEGWATVRYDCQDETSSLKFRNFRTEWKEDKRWYIPWIEKNLCANPSGFNKQKFLR